MVESRIGMFFEKLRDKAIAVQLVISVIGQPEVDAVAVVLLGLLNGCCVPHRQEPVSLESCPVRLTGTASSCSPAPHGLVNLVFPRTAVLVLSTGIVLILCPVH